MRVRLDRHALTIAATSALSLWLATAVAAQDSTSIEACRQALDECVIAAQTPADIEVCSAQEARCIAGEMQVPVPEDVPPDRLIQCTFTAAECALTARSADSLAGCTWALEQCIDAAVKAQFSCLDRYNECVLANPLLLPVCSLELLVCT